MEVIGLRTVAVCVEWGGGAKYLKSGNRVSKMCAFEISKNTAWGI